MSFVEATSNPVVGLPVSWLFTYLCLPWFGLEPSVIDATWITACYFVLSLARSYVLRRMFVALSDRRWRKKPRPLGGLLGLGGLRTVEKIKKSNQNR